MSKVFISGLGAITSLGNSVEESWQGILDGNSGIGEINQWDLSTFPYAKGAEVKNYKARELVKDRKLLKLISRLDVLGMAAADQALADSGILDYRDTHQDHEPFNEKTGVYVGSPGNKFFQQYDFMPLLARSKDDLKQFADHLFEEVHPMWLLKTLPNNVLAYTGIQHGFKGANQNVTNHVVGGLQAVIEAYYAIRAGQIDRAVVTAYDVGFEPQAQRYYGQLGILTNDVIRPFDQAHSGTVLGEGAGAVFLESEASLSQRGGKPYAEILAGKTTGDSQGIFSVDDQAKGLISLMGNLANSAVFNLQELGMIAAHANGNKKSDITESIAYYECCKAVPISGFKWALGHTLCASGLIDLVFTTKSVLEKVIPGIATYNNLSAECYSISVSNHTQDLKQKAAMVINRGFGGLNAGLLLQGS